MIIDATSPHLTPAAFLRYRFITEDRNELNLQPARDKITYHLPAIAGGDVQPLNYRHIQVNTDYISLRP